MRRSLFVLIPIFFLLSACTFQNNREEFNDIVIDESNIPYVLLNFHDSEIEIVEYTKLIFQLENDRPGTGFIEYSFIVDGIRFDYDGHGSNTAYFEIGPNWYQGKSIFSLSFEGLVKTGTGSLADRLDAEFYKISGSWTLKVDNHVPEKVNPELKFNNGYLEVSWNKANSKANLTYKLNIERIDKMGFQAIETFLFNKSDNLIFLDETFNGRKKKYWIEIVSNWYSVLGDTVTFQFDSIHCKHYDQGDYGVALVIDQLPFYNHAVKLNLIYRNTQISEINLRGDSILVRNPDFLINPELDFIFELTNTDYDQAPNLTSLNHKKLLNFTVIDKYISHAPYEVFFDSNRARVILVSSRGILELDPDNFQVLNSTPKSLPWGMKFFPHDSEKIFSVNNCGSHLVLDAIDLVNNYESSSIKLYERINLMPYGSKGSCVSYCADEKLIIQIVSNASPAMIYSLKADEIEYTDSLCELHMSGSGRYVINTKGSQILKLDSGIWKEIGTLNFNGPWHYLKIFDNWNGFENVFIFQDESVYQYQWPEKMTDFTEIDYTSKFEMESILYDPYFDHASGKITGVFFKVNGIREWVVIDSSDMTVLFRFEISEEHYGRFIKNAFYLTNGYILDLR